MISLGAFSSVTIKRQNIVVAQDSDCLVLQAIAVHIVANWREIGRIIGGFAETHLRDRVWSEW